MPHDCAEEGHQMVPHGGGSICNYCLTVVPPPVARDGEGNQGQEEIQFHRVYNNALNLPLTFQDLLNNCNLLAAEHVPHHVFEKYCPVTSDRSSGAAVKSIVSSFQKTSEGGTKNISNFKLSSVSPDKRPGLLSFDFDEVALEHVVGSYFSGSDEEFAAFLHDIVEKLSSLRNILYSVKRFPGLSDEACWQETRVQGMMQLFLNYAFDAFQKTSDNSGNEHLTKVFAANGDVIEFSTTCPNGESVAWRGYADLKCCGDDCCADVRAAASTIEMKVPFETSGLWHSTALAPKQQLLGQAIGRWHSSSNDYALSFLTDVFALAVMFYDGETAYLSRRVTGAKEVCLRLLLTFCEVKLEGDNLLKLMERTPSEVDLTGADLTGGDEHPDLGHEDQKQGRGGPVTRSQTRNVDKTAKSDSQMDEDKENVIWGTIGNDEEEEHEMWLEELSRMRRWEAKCMGVPFLGSDELRAM